MNATKAKQQASTFQVQFFDSQNQIRTKDFKTFGAAKTFASKLDNASISPLDSLGNDLGVGAWMITNQFGITLQTWMD